MTAEATTPAPSGDALRLRFYDLKRELAARFYQRGAEIDGLVAAAVAGEHVLLLGPPGTAKSDLTRAFAGRLVGATYFDWLLSKFTQPEEVFGPVSVRGLKADTFERITTGKLPEAHVAFLDEVFKANSAILNALLTLANERRFHNGTRVVDAPLRLVVGASNEVPSDEALGAFWDRFLLRYWVAPLQGRDDWAKVVSRAADPDPPATGFSLDELDEAHAAAMALPVRDDLLDAAFDVKRTLERDGIVASDRRWRKAFKVARAEAWLAGADEVEEEHCRIWAAVLWNDPEQAGRVAEVVGKMASPALARAQEVYDAIFERVADVEGLEGEEFEKRAASLNADARRALRRIDEEHKGAKSKGTRRAIAALGRDLKARATKIRERLVAAGDVDDLGF